MNASDGLPDKICQKCLITLKHAINFRYKCRQSDEYLRKVMEKAKSTTLFASLKKTKDQTEDPLDKDPFDMIEEVLEDDAEATEELELEENIENESIIYSAEVIDNCTLQKSTSSDIAPNKNNEKLKNNSTILAIQNEKTNLKSSLKSSESVKNEVVISKLQTLQHEQDNDGEENTKNKRKINLNSVERKVKTKLETSSKELNINHVIDTNNKSTYRVEFIVPEKEDTCEADVEDTRILRKSVDKKNQNVKLETENGSQLTKEVDKENYYLVLSQVDEDKNEQEFESDDEMDEMANDKQMDLIERNEEAEFVDVPNEEDGEFVLDDGDELSQENILEYNGDADSQSDNQKGGISEDMASTDNEEKKKTTGKNVYKKVRERRERKHLDKKIFPKTKKIREREKDNDSHVCETCGNHFTCRTSLKSHMRMHHKEKYHECELCSKRFTAACNLTAHMRTHTGEKPYACQFCDRRFSDRSTHIKHERTHTNEKPFQCNICLKSFSLSTSLRAHELVHTGEKRHSCSHCKKAFKLPHQLKAHYKTQLHKIIVNEISSNDGEQQSD